MSTEVTQDQTPESPYSQEYVREQLRVSVAATIGSLTVVGAGLYDAVRNNGGNFAAEHVLAVGVGGAYLAGSWSELRDDLRTYRENKRASRAD